MNNIIEYNMMEKEKNRIQWNRKLQNRIRI